MTRFAIEHLPRAVARYQVAPLDFQQAREWLKSGELTSLVRTTELIGAISAAFGVSLQQADTPMTLRPGDEALLISISFSVQLAWAQGDIVPVEDDWRCLLVQVEQPQEQPAPVRLAVVDVTAPSGETRA